MNNPVREWITSNAVREWIERRGLTLEQAAHAMLLVPHTLRMKMSDSASRRKTTRDDLIIIYTLDLIDALQAGDTGAANAARAALVMAREPATPREIYAAGLGYIAEGMERDSTSRKQRGLAMIREARLMLDAAQARVVARA
jgi:hypothetical protein